MLVTVLGSDFSADVSQRQRRREDRLDQGVQRWARGPVSFVTVCDVDEAVRRVRGDAVAAWRGRLNGLPPLQ